LTPKLEYDTRAGEEPYARYKKIMDIAKSFLTETERNEMDSCLYFLAMFDHCVLSMCVHDYQHTIDTLKQLKSEIEERLKTGKYVIERDEL